MAVSLAYAAFRDVSLFSAIEGQTLNWRFRLRGPIDPPATLAIVAIDDATIAKLKRWPVPRHTLADAIARIDAAGAKVLGLDLLFVEEEQPASGVGLGRGDQALADALRTAGRALLPMAFVFTPSPAPDGTTVEAVREAAFRVVRKRAGVEAAAVLRATGVLAPIAPLRQIADLGHVNLPVDADGSLRYLSLAVAFGDAYVPALPVEAARLFAGLPPGDLALLVGDGLQLGGRVIDVDPQLRRPIDYYGPTGTVPTYPLIDLLEGRVSDAALAGRVVLIGATALGVGDTFVTPFSHAMPGVEVLATAVGNLLDGQLLDRGAATRGWSIVAILALGFATFALARRHPPPLIVAVAAVLLAAWCAVAQLAFQHGGLWLDVTFPSLAILLSAGLVAVSRASLERRMRHNLARYHSPMIVDMLAESETPSFEGHEQQAAILFIDIAGSTRRAERLAPADVARFLHEFHGRIEHVVQPHGGMPAQFMGDGAMIIFGVPTPGPSDAAAALAAARDLAGDIRDWNAELTAAGVPPLAIGIGIHYGPVVITLLGGQAQAQLTAAGDTVNVASRIEALTRPHRADIAISGAAIEAVGAAGRTDLLRGFIELPPQQIRGREGRLTVWVVRGLLAPADPVATDGAGP
jgi:adenylate cyclase